MADAAARQPPSGRLMRQKLSGARGLVSTGGEAAGRAGCLELTNGMSGGWTPSPGRPGGQRG